MTGWLIEPLSYPFMQRAMVGAIALGIAAPVAGVWATSRRLVYLTDAMSHAILAGVAGAALVGGSLFAGGLVAAVVMALLVALLVVRVRLAEDSAVGVTGQGLFALGVIGVSLGADPRALSHVLFGNPLTLTVDEVVAQVGLAAIVVAVVVACLPVLIATTFDPAHARALGVRTGLVDTGVILGLGLVVVLGLTTVGVLMALTLCIAPAVTARLLSNRLTCVLILSAVLGVVAAAVGLIASYHLALPAGPIVAVLAVAEVAVAAGVRAFGRVSNRPFPVRPGRRGRGGTA